MSDLTKYKILYEGGSDEIVEKKSRFIANLKPVYTEEEAISYIEQIKKEYWDARHSCYAYVLGERGQIQRFSDDGEPQGTAGKPILDVLLGSEVRDAVIVVTRYFGGTLLGTGGLVRAYSRTASLGLQASKVAWKTKGMKLEIETDYTGLGKIQYILGNEGIQTLDSSYTDKVVLNVLVPLDLLEGLKASLIEGTNGTAKLADVEECWFAMVDKEVILL